MSFRVRLAAAAFGVVLVGAGVWSGPVRAQTSSAPPTTNANGQAPAPAPESTGGVAARAESSARFAAATDPVFADDPVAYWLLDDTGSTADDSVRPPRVAHPGLYQGSVSASSDNPGYELTGSRNFPGGPCDGVRVDPGVAQIPGAFSVEGWVRTTSASGVVFRWRWYGYLLRVSGGRASFEVSTSGSGGGFVGGFVLAGRGP